MKTQLQRIAFICTILLGWTSAAFAQNYATVSGVIIDGTTQKVLPLATVVLESNIDKNVRFGNRADMEGVFKISNVPNGSYNLKTSYVGYHPINKAIILNDNNRILGNISLEQNTKVLKAVKIEGEFAAVTQMGDTTQYRASSYTTNPDATANDLLEKMPGMQMKDGKLQAQGENVAKVLVDGRPFFGDDPNAALNNLPAKVISKIELFDEESEQSKFTGFDDGNTTKTINIVTKKEFRNGTFGNVYAGYGTDNKYSAGAVLNNFEDAKRLTILGQSNNINQQNFSSSDLSGVVSSSGNGRGRRGPGPKTGSSASDFLIGEQSGITTTNAIGLNYSNKWNDKTELTASYFFNNTDNDAKTTTTQNYFSTTNDGQVYNETEATQSENTNHRFNVRLTHEIDKNNSFILTPKFTIQKNNGISNLLAHTSLGDSLLNQTINDYSSQITAWNLSNTALLRHKFAKRGRTLSLNLDQDITQSDASSLLQANNIYSSTASDEAYDQEATLNQLEQTYSAGLMYTEPISRKINAMFQYRPSISITTADKQTMAFDGINESYSILDSSLSNVSETQYIAHRVGAGIRFNSRAHKFMVSADFQTATQSTIQELPYALDQSLSYNNFLPSFRWKYDISKNKSLRMMYRTSTNAPSITQLQEVVDNSNPIQLSMGNSELNQQYQHSLRARYSSSNFDRSSMFMAMLNATYTNDYIGSNTILANESSVTVGNVILAPGTQLSVPVNVDGYYTAKGMVTYGQPIKSLKSNLNLSLAANMTRTPGMINSVMNIVNSPSTEIGVTLSSNISKKVDFTIGSSSSINYTFNSLNDNLNVKYFNQNTTAKFYWNVYDGITFRTDVSNQYYDGLDDDFNTNYTLWNASLGYKFLKDDKAEVILSVFDLLNQNNSVARTTTQSYIQDTETQVLQRYGMLTFRYNIQSFKAGK